MGIVSDEEGAEGVDKAYGGKGKDNIRGDGEEGFFLLYGGRDDDTIVGGDGGGKIYGGSGNDKSVPIVVGYSMYGVVLATMKSVELVNVV